MRHTAYAVLALICTLSLLGGCADAGPPVATPGDARPLADTVSVYDGLLRAHVDADGWVDYAALDAGRAGLDAYVASLAHADAEGGSDAERLAHLINAYNAFTLVLILDAGTPGSIMDLDGGKPWDVVKWDLGGKRYSLNQIEHELIRPVFAEPRIHWALVCAAYSCPPLRNEAYTAERLEEQLAGQEAYVLNFEHPRYAVNDGGAIRVTPLFDWYGEDFVGEHGGADDYALKRLSVGSGSIAGYLDYDWKLNDVSNRPAAR